MIERATQQNQEAAARSTREPIHRLWLFFTEIVGAGAVLAISGEVEDDDSDRSWT